MRFALILISVLFMADIQAQTCIMPPEAEFQTTTLHNIAADIEPFEIAWLNETELMWITRHGKVNILNLSDNQSTEIHDLVTASELDLDEGARSTIGLIGLAADPDFQMNKWIYLMYIPGSDVNIYRLSRFTRSAGALVSEKPIIEIPREPVIRDHSGGSLAFGPGGTLYFSLGDNSLAGQSDGFTPIDESAGLDRDAQRSSGNTNDLRGKINRIIPISFADSESPVPGVGSTYQIPAGNIADVYSSLWNTQDLTKVRPEVYVMGCRNPFRIAVDPGRGWLSWGEVGPDATAADPARGPVGHDEWNVALTAGNYGWPFFVGPNQAYIDYDFSTGTSGAAFDVTAPMNTSVNNTGVQSLPPPQIPGMWLTKTGQLSTPDGLVQTSGGNTAMAGAFYDLNHNASPSGKNFPVFFHNKLIVAEWAGFWIKVLELDDEGAVTATYPFLEEAGIRRMMDMEFGDDGFLYILDWGQTYQPNDDGAKIVKVEYMGPAMDPALCGVTGVEDNKIGISPTPVKKLMLSQTLKIPGYTTGFELYNLKGDLIWKESELKGNTSIVVPHQISNQKSVFLVRYYAANQESK